MPDSAINYDFVKEMKFGTFTPLGADFITKEIDLVASSDSSAMLAIAPVLLECKTIPWY